MDSASVGFSLILRASSFSNSYDAVLAVIYLGILSIFFFPPLRGGLGWGYFSSYSQFSATAARISLYFFRACRTPLFYDFKRR